MKTSHKILSLFVLASAAGAAAAQSGVFGSSPRDAIEAGIGVFVIAFVLLTLVLDYRQRRPRFHVRPAARVLLPAAEAFTPAGRGALPVVHATRSHSPFESALSL